MKNLFVLIVLVLASCAVEENKTVEKINSDVRVENRSPGDWCDGNTLSDPAFFNIKNSYPNPLDPNECCIEFWTCGPSTIRLITSNYNFNTGSGSQTGQNYYTTLPEWGIGTICFSPIGTHFAVEVTCQGLTRCFVFSNQILDC